MGAGLEKCEPVPDVLETSRAAHKIGNSATSLGIVLAVFERYGGELTGGWVDAAFGEPAQVGTARLESVFGVRAPPVETAAGID